MSLFTRSVWYLPIFSPILYVLHFKCPFSYFPPCPLPLHIFPVQITLSISRGGGGIIHPCGGMQSAEVAVAALKYSGITWKRYNNFFKVRSYFASVWNLLNALAYTFEMLKALALLSKNWNHANNAPWKKKWCNMLQFCTRRNFEPQKQSHTS
jgi:hypothetical protein